MEFYEIARSVLGEFEVFHFAVFVFFLALHGFDEVLSLLEVDSGVHDWGPDHIGVIPLRQTRFLVDLHLLRDDNLIFMMFQGFRNGSTHGIMLSLI